MKKKDRLSSSPRKISRTAYGFISPIITHYAIFFWIPLLLILVVSFTKWDMFSPMEFRGFGNYKELLTDPLFRKSILISVTYALGTTFLLIALGMFLAIFFDRPNPIAGAARSLFFLMAVIPLISGAAIWVYITGPEPYSAANLVMKFFNLPIKKWQADPQLALPVVIGFAVWKMVGMNMLIYTAGLRGIPQDYYDCARIDGAKAIQRVVFITIPLLRPMTSFLIITNLLAGFNQFAPVWFITKGGPGSATRIIPAYIYQYGFGRFRYGYASAAAVILVCIIMVFTVIRLRQMKVREE